MGSSGLGLGPVGLLLAALLSVVGTALPSGRALAAFPACVARSGPIQLGVIEAGRVSVDGRLQDITLHSQAMHGDVHVDVLTPRGYDPSSGTRYPVLYLLHGVPGEPDRIMESVKDDLDRAFTTGGQAPFIVAAPTGGGTAHHDTEWADAADGKDMVESYLIKNVMPAVEGTSPRTAAQRAVAGFSMGGYGAANLALRHPDLFGQFVSLAGYFHVDDPSGMFGSDRGLEAANTPDDMVKKAAGKRVLLLEDQDETDSLIDGQAAEFAQRLHDCDCGVDLNWHLEPGGHSYDFVTYSFTKVIVFLNQGF